MLNSLNISVMTVRVVGHSTRSYKITHCYGLTFFAGAKNRIVYLTIYPDEVRLELEKPYDEVHQDTSGGIWFTFPPIGGSTKLVPIEVKEQL